MSPAESHAGDVVLGLSALGSGLAIYMAMVRFRRAVRLRSVWEVWYFLLDVGVAGLELTLAWRIFGVRHELSPTAPVVIYSVFLVLIAVAFVGIALGQGHHGKRSTDRREKT